MSVEPEFDRPDRRAWHVLSRILTGSGMVTAQPAAVTAAEKEKKRLLEWAAYVARVRFGCSHP